MDADSLGADSGDFLALLQQLESGGRNIPNRTQGTSSGQAQGFEQITTGTWNQFAPSAGVDLRRYPTPMSAPSDVQFQVARTIPMRRWDPKTLNGLMQAGYTVDRNRTLGENIALNGGGSGRAAAALNSVPEQDILGDALNPVAAGAAAQAASGIAPKAPVPLSAPVLNAVPETDILGEALGSAPPAGQTGAAATPAPPMATAPITNPNLTAFRENLAASRSSSAFSPPADQPNNPLLGYGGGLDVMNSIPILGPGILAAGAGVNALANGDSYADERALQQQQMARFNAANPKTAMGAGIAGSAIPSIAAGMTSPAMFGADAGAGWLTNALAGAATGGVVSGADTAAREYAAGQPIQAETVGRNALLGVALGGGASLGGSALGALGRGLTGGTMSAEDAALAQTARDKYEIPLNMGDLAASNSIGKFAASASNRLPFSGAEGFEAAQQSSFNRAVSQTIGEDAERLTPAVMNSAKARIGSVFDGVAGHTQIQADVPFDNAMLQAMTDAGKELSADELRPLNNIFENVIDKIDPATRAIDGSTYQAITRANTPLGRALSSPNPNISYYAGQIKDALDDALTRSAAPEDVQALQQAKDQWHNLKTIEPLVARGGGDISPGALAQTINSSRFSKNALAYGGGGDLGELAQIGTRFLREPQSSGTAERGAAYAAMAEVPAAISSVLAGHPAGAAVLPMILGGNRIANALMRSSWVTNPLINRSLPGAAPGLFRPAVTAAAAGAGNALLQGVQ